MAKSPKPVELCRWTLRWGNPYTRPPEGQPLVLGSVVLPRGESWEPHLAHLHTLGDGYAIHFQLEQAAPPRRLSEATKQSIRRKSLERRLRAKNPLFADAEIAAALAKNPDYYGT